MKPTDTQSLSHEDQSQDLIQIWVTNHSPQEKVSKITNDGVVYFFDWMLTNDCNFACDYCHPQIAIQKNKVLKKPRMSDEILQSFLSLEKKIHLSMSWWEPFLFPNYAEFCKEITSSGNLISINTNLSIRDEVKKFSQIVDPNWVTWINAALHKLEREKMWLSLEDFAEDIVMLQEKGFNIQVFYVLYPPLLSSFEEDAEYLKKLGVKKVAGKIFKGPYNGKIYPQWYSEEERGIIQGYTNNDYPITEEYLNDVQHMFKGKMCVAGANFFKINFDWSVQRCPANREPYWNIYDGTFVPWVGPKPCITNRVMAVSQCNQFSE